MSPRIPLAAAPALVPALAFLAAVALAPHLRPAPVLWLAALLILAAARRRPWAWLLFCGALGLLRAELAWLGPVRGLERIAVERPVKVLARVTSHPVAVEDRRLVRVRTKSLTQGEVTAAVPLDVLLALPADAPRPAWGSVLCFQGYLRRSRDLANRPDDEPGPWRLSVKSRRLLELEREPPWMLALADRLRRRAEAAFGERRGPGPALARALLLGDGSRLAERWRQGLRRLGLAHLLAVSGLHLGMAAAGLWLAGMALPRWARLGLVAAGTLVYLLLVGPRPSILRASAMALLALGALALERPPQALNALACGAAALVWLEPAMIADLGFGLSVAATAGLVILARPLAERWRRRPGPVALTLAATVAAQAATLPLSLPAFSGLAPLAPLWNLQALPWAALFLATAGLWLLAALVLSPWLPAAGPAFLAPFDVLAAPLEWLAAPAPGPLLWLPVSAPAPVALGLAAGLLAVAWWPRCLLAPAAAFGLAAALAAGFGPGTPVPELRMLDVGQGDALLLRDGRRAVLLDGGGWPRGDLGGRVLMPALAAAGVRRLDAVVLSHPDRDHCGGLVDIVRYLPVDELWTAPGWHDAPCAEELLGRVGLRWRVLFRGERARLGRWRFAALHPPARERGGRNDRSLVLLAGVPGHRVLLTGDVEAATERRLLARFGADLEAGVLKVAHHGSKSSSTQAFLAAVGPRLALVSAGRANPYGHPAPPALARLEAAGAWVLRSDRLGQVRLLLPPAGPVRVELPAYPRPASGS